MLKHVLLGAVVLLAGCNFTPAITGPTEHETRSIDLDKAEMVRVELKMGAGELKVNGGSPKLMDADFTYNIPSWKPELRYSFTGVRGDLTIEQPGMNAAHTGKTKYVWDLRFNNDVPLDLMVHLGAGEGEMNLSSISLRSVDIEMGAGQLKLDLRGHPKRDYDVRMRGGVGEATIYLPKDVGISADVKGGIGSIDVQGLHKDDSGHYVNDAWEKAKVKIHLDVRGGVGEIKLIAE